MEFIGIFILIIFLVGFLWGAVPSYVVSGLQLLALVIMMSRSMVTGMELFVFGAIVLFSPVVPFCFMKLRENYYEEVSGSLEDIRSSYQAFLEKDMKLKNLILEQDKEIIKLERIYEIAEKMSEALEFKDIFEILSELLRRNFSFRAGYLALVDEGEEFSIKQLYQIDPEGKISNPSMSVLEVMKRSFEDRRVVVGDPRFSMKLSSEFLSIKGEIVCAPFGVGKTVFGLIVLIGLSEKDFDRLGVIVNQFGLHMERINLYEEVQRLAITDGLTGIYVRRYFMERMKEEVERAKRRETPLNFLMIDLDFFKSYNDQFGHLVGDVLLREVAAILVENIREIDMVARYGGEEFSILLLDTGLENAIAVAERIRESVAKKSFRAYDEVLTITLSVGIAQLPMHCDNAEDLVDLADNALYKAKATGRNRVVVYGGE